MQTFQMNREEVVEAYQTLGDIYEKVQSKYDDLCCEHDELQRRLEEAQAVLQEARVTSRRIPMLVGMFNILERLGAALREDGKAKASDDAQHAR